MTIYSRPDNSIFASGAKQEETGTFPDIERGWGVTEKTNFIPPLEYFNAVQNRTDKAIAYLLQRGVAEWSKDIEYPQQAITIKNGQVFFAKQQNANKDPLFNPEIWVNSFAQKANQADFYSLKNAMIGIPLPHPLETVPENHLAMNGQTFKKSLYPELAKKYPSGKLPDMRGLVIRGWDNGRGYDSGRELLTYQDDAIQYHEHWLYGVGDRRLTMYTGTDYGTGMGIRDVYGNSGNATGAWARASEFAKGKVSLAETRVKNIAFNWICLAR